jgi:hypothetical protein
MKMKASVDYGIRAMLYLAAKGTTCSSREISEEMQVPRDYLIQLALRLRNAGLPLDETILTVADMVKELTNTLCPSKSNI